MFSCKKTWKTTEKNELQCHIANPPNFYRKKHDQLLHVFFTTGWIIEVPRPFSAETAAIFKELAEAMPFSLFTKANWEKQQDCLLRSD